MLGQYPTISLLLLSARKDMFQTTSAILLHRSRWKLLLLKKLPASKIRPALLILFPQLVLFGFFGSTKDIAEPSNHSMLECSQRQLSSICFPDKVLQQHPCCSPACLRLLRTLLQA